VSVCSSVCQSPVAQPASYLSTTRNSCC